MHGSDGSLLWGTPSWPATRSAGACCPVDVPRVCATLCQGSEERRTRCGSDCGSSDAADHAVCRDQERGVGQQNRWEICKVRRDGTLVWVRENAKAVRRSGGDLIVLIVCEDINDRKRGE